MMGLAIQRADFLFGAVDSSQLAKLDGPLVAFAGRSNVGKSSLINRVTARKNLARVSKTPGRTREINVFAVKLHGPQLSLQFHLLDLPGYGFARVAKIEREKIQNLIVDCLHNVPNLKVLCLLNDSKRTAELEERKIRDIAFENDISCQIVVTKVDRLNQAQKTAQTEAIARSYGLEPEDLILTGTETDPTVFWERIQNQLL